MACHTLRTRMRPRDARSRHIDALGTRVLRTADAVAPRERAVARRRTHCRSGRTPALTGGRARRKERTMGGLRGVLLLAIALCMPAQPAHAGTGVLLLAHGGNADWNVRVQELAG